MKKTITKKLRVQPETLRPLSPSKITGVAGAGISHVLNTYDQPATKCADDTSCPGRGAL